MGTAFAGDGQRLGVVVAGGAGTTLGKAVTMRVRREDYRRSSVVHKGAVHTRATKGHLSEVFDFDYRVSRNAIVT
jgi:hypothetical protein